MSVTGKSIVMSAATACVRNFPGAVGGEATARSNQDFKIQHGHPSHICKDFNTQQGGWTDLNLAEFLTVIELWM